MSCRDQVVREAGEDLPLRGSLQRVPDVDVLPPLPPVEVSGAPARHLQDIPHVPRAR